MSTPAKVDKFEGESFHTWQTRIKFALMKKSLWSIVNGKEKKPTTRDASEEWAVRDEKALVIIALGLGDRFIHHIDRKNTSLKAWEELERVFGIQAKTSKISLLINFFELKYDASDGMSAYINRMKSIITQLAGLKIVMDEDVCIVVLLKGLPDEDYGTLITTIKNLPSPKLHDVEVSIIQEERKLKSSNGNNNQNVAYSMAKSRLRCKYCHKRGHEEMDCIIKLKKGIERTNAITNDDSSEEEDLASVEATTNLVSAFAF